MHEIPQKSIGVHVNVFQINTKLSNIIITIIISNFINLYCGDINLWNFHPRIVITNNLLTFLIMAYTIKKTTKIESIFDNPSENILKYTQYWDKHWWFAHNLSSELKH